MRTSRVTMIIALSVAAVALPTAAGAGGRDQGPSEGPDLSAAYLYRKVDASAPASWENSGRQTLFSLRDGHSWLGSINLDSLPGEVCGPGWAVQEDWTHDITRDQVPTIIDRATPTGVLGWPPVVDARHRELTAYVEVPDCVEVLPEVVTPPVVTPPVVTPPVVTPPVVTPPVVTPPVVTPPAVAGAAVPVATSPRFTG